MKLASVKRTKSRAEMIREEKANGDLFTEIDFSNPYQKESARFTANPTFRDAFKFFVKKKPLSN